MRLLHEYPDVFDALHQITEERYGEPRSEGFMARRERTRAQRLARYQR